jgi:hypothetical protein
VTACPSDIDIDVSSLHTLDSSAHQVSLAILEFIVDIVPLRLPDFLEDDLLGRLSSDPAKIGAQFYSEAVSGFDLTVKDPGFVQQNLDGRVCHLFHDLLNWNSSTSCLRYSDLNT